MSCSNDVDRLEEDEIADVLEGLDRLDEESRRISGLTIAEIACESAGFDGASFMDGNVHLLAGSDASGPAFPKTDEPVKGGFRAARVAVVPVTSGYGLIGGFAKTVAGILEHVGADAFVTEQTDLSGVEEAHRRGASIVFLADDYTFCAIGIAGAALSDNGVATGHAFATALAHMGAGNEALVLGAGPVGTAATERLVALGFDVSAYDTDEARLDRLVARTGARKETSASCIGNHRNILDATTGAGFITRADVTPETCISAPGIPLGVTQEAARTVRLFHNPLELGVAAMYFDCLRQLSAKDDPVRFVSEPAFADAAVD